LFISKINEEVESRLDSSHFIMKKNDGHKLRGKASLVTDSSPVPSHFQKQL
jgi:hypothetical protein